MLDAALFVVSLVTVMGMTMACGRASPPRDKTPPVVLCPPDIEEKADPFQVNTKVNWDEDRVVANDDRDGNIPWRRTGWGPGTIFSEGITKIIYSAKDASGNNGYCILKIKVVVQTCNKWGSITDGWKICHVSHDSSHVRRGSVCRFGCYGGHKLDGPDRSACLDTGSWDIQTQPICKKLQCPPLNESHDFLIRSCTNGNNYRSVCSYICEPGYSILPGTSKVRVCNEYGSWLGSVPQCVDTKPPTYDTCPYGVTVYAARAKTSGLAFWDTPKAQDNSGHLTTIQKSGPISGTDLEVGEYLVEYTSYDSANNTAICAFNVVVKQIKCHRIYPLPYTSVMCPTGRIYGSTCQFLCDNGTSMNGNESAVCTNTSTNSIQYGVWTFGNRQTYCEQQNECPVLEPPDNAHLVCDTWLSGRFCQTQCQNKHVVIDDPTTDLVDEVAIHKTLRVCGDSCQWLGPDVKPACQRVSDSQWTRMKIRLTYLFPGVCTENKDEIKQKLFETFKKGLSAQSCHLYSCNIKNVQVLSGDITKRDTSIHKREGLFVEYTVDLPSDIDGVDALRAQTNVTKSFNVAIENGDLDIEVDDAKISPIAEVSQPQRGCNEGSVFDQQSMMCVECTTGYFYSSKYDKCVRCPVGYYQDEERQTRCKVCPIRTTTTTTGASSLQKCKDACEEGYYSQTGIKPCTVCDLGTYSTSYGSTTCTSCPGSQITLKSASTSSTQCQEFDITYTVLNDTETSVPAVLPAHNMTIGDNVTLELWVKCSQCDNILDITDIDGTQFVHIEDTYQIRLTWLGAVYETNKSIVGSDTWKKITITTYDGVVSAYIDTTEVLNEVYTYRPIMSTINVTAGGDGFVGSISQLHMWSAYVDSPPSLAGSCFTVQPGDLFAWKQFSELDGTFTITKSKCDSFDNCVDSPCQNGGLCVDGKNSFSCTCTEGFTGSVCDVNIDDCAQSVCDNRGTCVDGVGNYTCQCPDGFKGEFCEIKYIDGGWTEWITSGGCSVTCGYGVQNRSRVCENPEPSNGGKQCEGDDTEMVECETNTTCVLECLTDPPGIVNGSINCFWTDETNDTRECHPSCDEGFDFDNDLFVYTSGIMCGPHTGYSWNINTTDNPLLVLPSCTPKSQALTNTLNYTMNYTTLHVLTIETSEQIHQVVDGLLNQTGCVGTGQCKLQTMVYQSNSVPSSTSGVLLTLRVSCDVTNDIDECYNLLADLVQTLETMIMQVQFTVQYDGMEYDVGLNTSSLSGITTCKTGHVQVWHYCVACGKGTYAYNNYCEVCPVGTYQDLEAQTSCLSCPTDWTTSGYMTRDRSLCNVYIPYTDKAITKSLLISLAVALSLVGVAAITVIVVDKVNKSRSFSPPSCYNNYVGPDSQIDEHIRPLKQFQLT